MPRRVLNRPERYLLFSLLFTVIIYPILERTGLGRVISAFAIFIPLSFATIEMASLRRWGRLCFLLVICTLILGIAQAVAPRPIIASAKWVLVASFLALSVFALFKSLWATTTITTEHLYTAVSIYFLLALAWFALYSAIDAIYPAAFIHSATGPSNRASDLLYYSLITLTTAGYGDILPRTGEVRILAALEAAAGVLYVAITIALLVSAYRQPPKSREE